MHAYPSGGGDYEVAQVNLGQTAGTTVASALLVDYILTVAVSISSASQYAASAISVLQGHEALFGSVDGPAADGDEPARHPRVGSFFAVPTYAFMVAILGHVRSSGSCGCSPATCPDVESADLTIIPDPSYDGSLTTIALLFLLARAFSSGCAALTGVEAISNGVPAFQRPKSKNAATTLLLLGMIAITMMVSVIVLAKQMGLRYVDPRDFDRLRLPTARRCPADYDQHAVIAQIARAVFPDFEPGFYFVVTVTGVILVLAANTAFNGFPVLGSILAKDGYAPARPGLAR